LLGGVPAFLSIAAVIIIQCLFFADGGLLALGCNIFNMGVIPCLIVYPLLFRPLLQSASGYKRLSAAALASAMLGLELGAFCVVLQTLLSGITALPFGAFAALMLPVHLAIGLVEGIVTAAILCFVYQTRPEIIVVAAAGGQLGGIPLKKTLAALAALTIVAGGVLSLFASANPDGLEWAIGKTAAVFGAETELTAQGAIFDSAASLQEGTAFLPDYAFAADPENAAGTPVSGLVGAAITCALAWAAGAVIARVKKRKKAAAHV
jgi:cobalt/nickel transport system permease protein